MENKHRHHNEQFSLARGFFIYPRKTLRGVAVGAPELRRTGVNGSGGRGKLFELLNYEQRT